MKKYIIYSGYVTSKTDGQEHFVSCKELVKLYGVNIKECCLIPFGQERSFFLGSGNKNLIKLFPREDEFYDIIEEQDNE